MQVPSRVFSAAMNPMDMVQAALARKRQVCNSIRLYVLLTSRGFVFMFCRSWRLVMARLHFEPPQVQFAYRSNSNCLFHWLASVKMRYIVLLHHFFLKKSFCYLLDAVTVFASRNNFAVMLVFCIVEFHVLLGVKSRYVFSYSLSNVVADHLQGSLITQLLHSCVISAVVT